MRLRNFVLGIFVGTIFSSALVIAWSGPDSAPTGNNVDAPINVGSVSQTKDGPLQVNGFQNVGHTLLSGISLYLNFGDTAGEDGYGFRDNVGTIEVKNAESLWARVATTTAEGAFDQIKFADGTVQTSAATTSSGTIGGECYKDGTGWGNAIGCGTPSCSSTKLTSCPTGYTARKTEDIAQKSCAGGIPQPIVGAPSNCGCGSYQANCSYGKCTGYNPGYYPIAALCIRD